MDWKEFWENYRKGGIFDDYGLMCQAGRTVGGKPIDKYQFGVMVGEIASLLELNTGDYLLDLCCGNGIVTYELAKRVWQVKGVDFSRPHIKNAKKFKGSRNIDYCYQDVTETETVCSKILMSDALAYFSKKEFGQILKNCYGVTVTILLASVLDKKKKWKFYNTPSRKLRYFVNLITRHNVGVGRFWSRKEIEKVCRQNGFTCTFHEQNKLLYTAHYRMDVLIKRG